MNTIQNPANACPFCPEPADELIGIGGAPVACDACFHAWADKNDLCRNCGRDENYDSRWKMCDDCAHDARLQYLEDR